MQRTVEDSAVLSLLFSKKHGPVGTRSYADGLTDIIALTGELSFSARSRSLSPPHAGMHGLRGGLAAQWGCSVIGHGPIHASRSVVARAAGRRTRKTGDAEPEDQPDSRPDPPAAAAAPAEAQPKRRGRPPRTSTASGTAPEPPAAAAAAAPAEAKRRGRPRSTAATAPAAAAAGGEPEPPAAAGEGPGGAVRPAPPGRGRKPRSTAAAALDEAGAGIAGDLEPAASLPSSLGPMGPASTVVRRGIGVGGLVLGASREGRSER
jgi:hypothetical protein